GPATMDLVPGEARPVRFTCDLAEGHDYDAHFSLAAPGSQDLQPADNQRTVRIHVARGTAVRIDTLAVTPRLGTEQDKRTLRASLVNSGYGRETVDLDLKVERQDVQD